MEIQPLKIVKRMSFIRFLLQNQGKNWIKSFFAPSQRRPDANVEVTGQLLKKEPNISVICPFCSNTVMIHDLGNDTCPSCNEKFKKETEEGLSAEKEYTLKSENILDTTEFHLAYVPENIPIKKFFERIVRQIQKDKLPLSCKVCMAKWKGGDYELRPRIIVNLKDHLWSSIRIIAGIDYMGGWCTFQLLLIDDPSLILIPEAKKPPVNIPLFLKLASLSIFLFGIYQYSIGFWNSLIFVGLGCATFILALAQTAPFTRKKEDFEKEKADAEEKFVEQMVTAKMKVKRSFKHDDLKLFCTAMRSVLISYMELLFQEGSMLVKEVKGEKGFFGS